MLERCERGHSAAGYGFEKFHQGFSAVREGPRLPQRTGLLACAGDRVHHEASGLQVVEPF